MKGNILEAVEYANGSNKLENNNLSNNELEQIVENILAGKSDQSFLFSVVEAVKQIGKEIDETGQVTIDPGLESGVDKINVKTRK